ncbi:exodeoxyribonuclease VII large subunit [Falsarthrobacter nasiphocae]|uniref:Exodeoxyribonuclease 7 large subunit n=1 Tax=Falsarthrobacter nasiphocae TaxID=189863 RepID=A0AAE4C6K5_9MICC|nr:exodeoxyribonuclease VII large subunit [Falsarthrobacter nasiphocae]MDR6891564.1 exodeoxyribonuclease VII large subunit [Falsarthrobacter nasiphocae]
MTSDETAPPPATAGETTPERPWPVRVFASKLKTHVERAPRAWVEGQLVELNRRGQNTFMVLRDADEEVSLPASAWGNQANTSAPGIEVGARVVAEIRPQMWLKTGRLSMNVTGIRPVGLGDLLARIEQLRRSLADEGLFRPDRKRPLPALPGRIGLITGRNSDAEKDVLRNATLRWPAVQFEIRNVAVQGTRAVPEVMEALAELDAMDAVDVIVIARGGGALEDLLPFSDESLVRAVAAARTPVVSAIGHEADRPVLDDVADLRASTPTDAAKRIVPDIAEERERLAAARYTLTRAVTMRIERERERIAGLRSRPALLRPETIAETQRERLTLTVERLRRTMDLRVDREATHVEHTLARVRSLSPQHTLNRGYAVVQKGSAVVTDAADLAPGDEIRVLLARGRVLASVTGAEGSPPSPHDDDAAAAQTTDTPKDTP